MNRQLTQYNSLVYESGPIKFNDYVNNNPNKIHIRLYEDAINKFIEHYCISQIVYNSIIYPRSEEYSNIVEIYGENTNNEEESELITKMTIDEYLYRFKIQNLGYKEEDGNCIEIYSDEHVANVLLTVTKIKKVYNSFDHKFLTYKTIKSIDKNEHVEFDSHDVIFPNYNPNIIDFIEDDTFKYDKFIEVAKNNFKSNVYIVERYSDEFWKPSSIVIFHNMNKMLDYKEDHYLHICKQEISLEKWWNHTQDKNLYKPQNIKITDERLANPQVKYLDYIRGKAIMNDKIKPDLDFNIDFSVINEDTDISDEYLLKELFRTKLNNIE